MPFALASGPLLRHYEGARGWTRDDGRDDMFFDIGTGEVVGIVTVFGVTAVAAWALVRSFRRPRA